MRLFKLKLLPRQRPSHCSWQGSSGAGSTMVTCECDTSKPRTVLDVSSLPQVNHSQCLSSRHYIWKLFSVQDCRVFEFIRSSKVQQTLHIVCSNLVSKSMTDTTMIHPDGCTVCLPTWDTSHDSQPFTTVDIRVYIRQKLSKAVKLLKKCHEKRLDCWYELLLVRSFVWTLYFVNNHAHFPMGVRTFTTLCYVVHDTITLHSAIQVGCWFSHTLSELHFWRHGHYSSNRRKPGISKRYASLMTEFCVFLHIV